MDGTFFKPCNVAKVAHSSANVPESAIYSPKLYFYLAGNRFLTMQQQDPIKMFVNHPGTVVNLDFC